jgi:hypothetical protein
VQGAQWDTLQRRAASSESESLQRTLGRSRSYAARCEAAASSLAALREPIWDLFNRLGCNTPSVKELLGADELGEGNLMAYLGVIEQRASELLQVRLGQGRAPAREPEAPRRPGAARPRSSASAAGCRLLGPAGPHPWHSARSAGRGAASPGPARLRPPALARRCTRSA